MEDPSLGSGIVLDRWEAEERRLSKWDLCRVAKELRKFRRHKLALEVPKRISFFSLLLILVNLIWNYLYSFCLNVL